MRNLLILLCFISTTRTASAQPELIYHVFQRSFFDSNGDGHGDLNGMRQKLDYLQDLGVTDILLTPLYLSDFYHNYFANDFEQIDPSYGSMNEYLQLVKEVHRRKMKIWQDVEMQYVTGKHKWFLDSYKNPSSAYSRYLLYNDAQNEQPWWFFGIPEFVTYNNSLEQIIMVNMKDSAVKNYTRRILEFWMDPNGDGKFDDGVDGFRLDHMMDDLDNTGKLNNLFAEFWSPMLDSLRSKNPTIRIVAEQANWASYGFDYLERGGVDRVFAFRLKYAIGTFNKNQIITAADSCFHAQNSQVVFIENHDTPRFASLVNSHPGKLRAAAALNILLGGIPSIYYGQELGMKGTQLKGQTDGNDIPIREAFEWYRTGQGRGMAYWYKETGPWWDSSQVKPADGISLEEQKPNKSSLFNYYKKLISLRKANPALYEGRYQSIGNENQSVISFTRACDKQTLLIAVNLSDQPQQVLIDIKETHQIKMVYGPGAQKMTGSKIPINIPAYGLAISELKK